MAFEVAEEALALGRYRLGSRIGAGSAGSVFRAVDTHSGQDVVLKFFDGQEDGFPLWTSEMRLAMRLRNRNIAACLDVGFDERQCLWVLVFEQAKGGSLRRALVSGRRFTMQQIARVLHDIASALAYAHEQGVVHRDVKPENILAQDNSDDTAWLLTDFGAGRYLAKGEVAPSLAGSVEYMAPEVLMQKTTAASDQFSLGVVGMELWLGKLPSKEERPAIVSAMQKQPGLLKIIGRMAESDPEQRFEDMAAVAASLQQELMEMKHGGDVTEILRRYLSERRGLSSEQQLRLMEEWDKQESFAEFLVRKNLLPRSMARAMDAVRNGYVDMSLESVLGISAPLPASEPPEAQASGGAQEVPLLPPNETVAQPVSARSPIASLPKEAALQPASSSSPPAEALPAAAEPAKEEPAPIPAPRAPEPAKPPRLTKPAPGLRLGRYVLQEPLGEGATAAVFRSYHEMFNVPIAIKVFEPIDLSSDPDAAQRFRREAQSLIRLEHPHVVRVLDVDIFEQFPFMVMEYVGETTLASQIQNLGRLPATRIAQIGIAVADALEATWKMGLLHRDVKPSTVLAVAG